MVFAGPLDDSLNDLGDQVECLQETLNAVTAEASRFGVRPASNDAESATATLDSGASPVPLEEVSSVIGSLGSTRVQAEHRVEQMQDGLFDMQDAIQVMRSELARLTIESESRADRLALTDQSDDSAWAMFADLRSRMDRLASGLETLSGLRDTMSTQTSEAGELLAAQGRGSEQLERDLQRVVPTDEQARASHIIEVFRVKAGSEIYALPTDVTERVWKPELPKDSESPVTQIDVDGELLPFLRFAKWLGLDLSGHRQDYQCTAVIVKHEGQRAVVLVDDTDRRSRERMHSLGPQLENHPWFRGALTNGEEAPIPVLNVAAFIRDAHRANESDPNRRS